MKQNNIKLKNACVFYRGLTYSKKDEVSFSGNVVLRANNIDLKSHRLELSDLRYISDEIAIPKNKKIKKNSLIICTASGSKSHLGKVALIDIENEYAFGGFMGLIIPMDEVNPKYLFYVMISDKYREFVNNLSAGANINNLTFSLLGEFEFRLPEHKEQEYIVKKLDEFFEKKTQLDLICQKQMSNLEELKECVLKKAFSGEL